MLFELEELRKKLKNENIRALSAQLGLNSNTVYQIARGETKPTYNVLVTLSRHFEAEHVQP